MNISQNVSPVCPSNLSLGPFCVCYVPFFLSFAVFPSSLSVPPLDLQQCALLCSFPAIQLYWYTWQCWRHATVLALALTWSPVILAKELTPAWSCGFPYGALQRPHRAGMAEGEEQLKWFTIKQLLCRSWGLDQKTSAVEAALTCLLALLGGWAVAVVAVRHLVLHQQNPWTLFHCL